jgi:NADH-quinone oxidoreductase subunit L
MSTATLGVLTVLPPLAVALLCMVVAPLRRSGRLAAALSVLAASTSLAASVALLKQTLEGAPGILLQWPWLVSDGQTVATVGMQLDGVSIPMLVVVSFVATAVQIFSLSYMDDEPPASYGRYFTWHALFLFSMQGLVLAPNLLQLFAAWELVGLCSYLLIGFYYRKSAAGKASLKAFWITKLADMGLLLGLILHYVVAGTFTWDPASVQALGMALPWVAGLYFFAVMGKSAQFPLHVWLPDAMEGPTPVSALLHAATMVAAGVYLLVRAQPIFLGSEVVLQAMAVIGGFTAVFAAVIAIAQTDIKKVLAYSTCSQLGYMVSALGAGSLMGGYFHLTTHAFFKALLFLCAGSIIHAVHSNELKDMGGLAKKMPLTSGAFVVGAAALAGLPPLSGFYSKDMVLEALWESAHHDPIFWFPFACCMITVGLTAYYMSRVVFLALFGAPSEAAAHAHEGSWAMRLPLLALLVPTVGAGFTAQTAGELFGIRDLHFDPVHITEVGMAGVGLAVLGIVVAYVLHVLGRGQALVAASAPVGRLIEAGAVDKMWAGALGLRSLSDLMAWTDRYVVDGLVNASGALTLGLGQRLRGIQTGRVADYLYAAVLGMIAITAFSQTWLAGAL